MKNQTNVLKTGRSMTQDNKDEYNEESKKRDEELIAEIKRKMDEEFQRIREERAVEINKFIEEFNKEERAAEKKFSQVLEKILCETIVEAEKKWFQK